MEYWRQLDIADPADFTEPVTIVGCGGIGSPTALALAKMGVPKLHLCDDDYVEPHNLANQIYRRCDVGKPKVEALKEICTSYADAEITTEVGRFCGPGSGIVVSGVDSMAARQEIWHRIKYNPSVTCYVDGRMGGQVGMALMVNPIDRESAHWYESTLYSDDEAEPIACTNRAIIYNVFLLAALIAHGVKDVLIAEDRRYDKVIFDFVTMNLIKEQRASVATELNPKRLLPANASMEVQYDHSQSHQAR